jgi:hypothetical protein
VNTNFKMFLRKSEKELDCTGLWGPL